MGILIGDNILPTLLSYSWRKWTTSGKQRFLCTVQEKHLWRWLQKKGKHWTINWKKSVQNVMHLLAFARKLITTMLFVEHETKYYCWFCMSFTERNDLFHLKFCWHHQILFWRYCLMTNITMNFKNLYDRLLRWNISANTVKHFGGYME